MADPVKVTYKEPKTSDEFFIFANQELVDKWKKDKSIPMVDVVQSYEVYYVPNGGNTGQADRPAKGLLESAFGTHDEDEIVKQILEHGEIKHTHHGIVGHKGAMGKGGDKGDYK